MELISYEVVWRDRQPWLQMHGYQLRARFQPDWVPSWVSNPPKDMTETLDREDNQLMMTSKLIDAVRVRDNKQVMLKVVALPGYPDDHELAILRYLSSSDVSQDPQNRCVPIYEVLYNVPDDPNIAIVVMPLLREFCSPRFDTVGECLGFFKDLFEGVQFLHRHRIAHRDCTGLNLMMDASELYPDGFHPLKQNCNRELTKSAVQKYTRTQRPPKYYWIDFGLSVRFHLSEPNPRFSVLRGNDKSPPEFNDPHYMSNLQDPFPTDIYYLGNLIRQYFTEGFSDFDSWKKSDLSFMEPLVEKMTHSDRARRPTIDQCVAQLEEIIRTRSLWTLRSQIRDTGDNIFSFIYHFSRHWINWISYTFNGIPPIPKADYTTYPSPSC